MYFEFVPPVIKYILMMFRIIVIPEKKSASFNRIKLILV